jgi:hypothetical protein
MFVTSRLRIYEPARLISTIPHDCCTTLAEAATWSRSALKVVVSLPCRVLLDEVAGAYASGDVVALKALYAEDALVCSAALPDSVFTRDQVFARKDILQRTALIGPIDLIPIDESAGLLRATVRTTRDGVYQSAERVWLLTFTDGLIYRQRVLASREAAVDLYQRHGIGLGMEPPA